MVSPIWGLRGTSARSAASVDGPSLMRSGSSSGSLGLAQWSRPPERAPPGSCPLERPRPAASRSGAFGPHRRRTGGRRPAAVYRAVRGAIGRTGLGPGFGFGHG